jgi:hypothetical protein
MRRLAIIVASLWTALVLGEVLIFLSGVDLSGFIAGMATTTGAGACLLAAMARLRRQQQL